MLQWVYVYTYSVCVCVGGALVAVLVVLAPIREALHATEITGQITIQYLSLDLSQTPCRALEIEIILTEYCLPFGLSFACHHLV